MRAPSTGEGEAAEALAAIREVRDQYATMAANARAADDDPEPDNRRVVALERALARLASTGASGGAELDALELLEEEGWALVPRDVPIADTGDQDVWWTVIQYHMAEPHERAVGEGGRTPRAALEAALRAEGFRRTLAPPPEGVADDELPRLMDFWGACPDHPGVASGAGEDALRDVAWIIHETASLGDEDAAKSWDHVGELWSQILLEAAEKIRARLAHPGAEESDV